MGNGADYLNCPMDEAQYTRFVDALLSAPLHEFKDWEKVPYFDGCLPIEVMAERGRDTLRWGPMKPVGLTNPRNPTVKAHAIVQLRQEWPRQKRWVRHSTRRPAPLPWVRWSTTSPAAISRGRPIPARAASSR